MSRTYDNQGGVHGPRIVNVAHRPERELLRACAAFGVAVRLERKADAGKWRAGFRTIARELHAALPARGVAFITGPSGAGKSSVLVELQREIRAAGGAMVRVGGGARANRASVVGSLRGPVRERLMLLASVGLSEATLFARSHAELSEGQRFRLKLARAAQRAVRACGRGGSGRAVTLVADEFAGSLDRVTARSVAAGFAKWARRTDGIRVVIATSHDDLLEALGPEVLVWMPLVGGAELRGRGGDGDGARAVRGVGARRGRKTLGGGVRDSDRRAGGVSGA